MFYPNTPLSLSSPTINPPNPSLLNSQSVIKMEVEQSMEITQPVNNSSDDGFAPHLNNSLSHLSNSNGGRELENKWSAEEVKGTLEITASTGKFWHDWEDLRSILYFQLKQVLSEYPEAIMGDNEQNSALGESYLKLVKRMEEALFSFVEGPPFTLQRLSEILLNARTIYPKLSKLALALEKNLLVTSTLIKSTDPYPPTIVQTGNQVEDIQPLPEHQALPQSQPELQPSEPQHQPTEPHHQPTEPQHQLSEPQHQPAEPEPQHQPPEPEPQHQPPEPELQHQPPEPELQHQPPELESQHQQSDPHVNSLENGGDLMTGDRDEVMSEVVAEVDGGMTMDMETFEDIISSSDANPQPDSKL